MKLKIRKSESLGDWYVIERAEHDGRMWLEPIGRGGMSLRSSARFSDADVEGRAEEMLAIAKAIEEGRDESFRRCAVRIEGHRAFFWSPRNSETDGEVSLDEAKELAAQIRQELGA